MSGVGPRRSRRRSGDGDQIEFVVSAVNTGGTNTNLQYGLHVQPDGGSFMPLIVDNETGHLSCIATPPGRRIVFRVTVRDVSGGHDASGWDDEAMFTARIKPVGLR
jgi:hypothetical protein